MRIYINNRSITFQFQFSLYIFKSYNRSVANRSCFVIKYRIFVIFCSLTLDLRSFPCLLKIRHSERQKSSSEFLKEPHFPTSVIPSTIEAFISHYSNNLYVYILFFCSPWFSILTIDMFLSIFSIKYGRSSLYIFLDLPVPFHYDTFRVSCLFFRWIFSVYRNQRIFFPYSYIIWYPSPSPFRVKLWIIVSVDISLVLACQWYHTIFFGHISWCL